MLGDRLILEEVNDPAEAARCRAQHEWIRLNGDWLESHWGDVLPQARGKHLAVAGQEAFQSKHIAALGVADNYGPACPSLDQTHTTQDEGAHNPLPNFRLRNE